MPMLTVLVITAKRSHSSGFLVFFSFFFPTWKIMKFLNSVPELLPHLQPPFFFLFSCAARNCFPFAKIPCFKRYVCREGVLFLKIFGRSLRKLVFFTSPLSHETRVSCVCCFVLRGCPLGVAAHHKDARGVRAGPLSVITLLRSGRKRCSGDAPAHVTRLPPMAHSLRCSD